MSSSGTDPVGIVSEIASFISIFDLRSDDDVFLVCPVASRVSVLSMESNNEEKHTEISRQQGSV